jgi:predicted RNase H-like nuclease (RuvC/YqgF family)
MQHIMNLEIERLQKDIEYKFFEKMRNSRLLIKHINIGNRERVRRLENENNDLEKSMEDSKMRIQSLQQEKEKLKMDALKYYKGKPSQQFEEVWDIRETEHKERLNSIRGSGIDMWNKEQSTLK